MAMKANVNISLSRLAEILAAPFQGGGGGEVSGGGGYESSGGGGGYGGAPGRAMTPSQQQTYDFREATNPADISKAQSAADLERTKALVERMKYYEQAYQNGTGPENVPQEYRTEYIAYARDKGTQDDRLNKEMTSNPIYVQQRDLGMLPNVQGRPNTGISLHRRINKMRISNSLPCIPEIFCRRVGKNRLMNRPAKRSNS